MSCIQQSRSTRLNVLFTLSLLLLLAAPSIAYEKPTIHQGNTPPLTSALVDEFAKSFGDSILVMGPWGSGATYNGQFELNYGAIQSGAWNDWTSHDNTVMGFDYWHVDTYHAANLNDNGEGNQAAWCGVMDFAACDAGDSDGGYGNNMVEALVWETVVADPSLPTVVSIDAWLNYDVEPGYDFVKIGCYIEGDTRLRLIRELNGIGENYHLQGTFTYQPGDYIGDAGNKVHLEILVTSDSAWSDEDCSYASNGAVQIDDIAVNVDNGNISYFEDFEDGTLGSWEVVTFSGVGDFANLRSGLVGLDDCNYNHSVQVNFVDDGIVVPGTGGSTCYSWCYGPGGYTVNVRGGIAGPDYTLDNSILSPVMAMPDDSATGLLFEYDAYEHEIMDWDTPIVFTQWDVRSTASEDPAAIENASWENNYMTYFEVGYRRYSNDVSGLLVPGAKFVQVKLSVVQSVNQGPFEIFDPTPAPYFDNVRLTAFEVGGPAMSASEAGLANDGFPAIGILDVEQPGNNSVRFDMARNIAADEASAVVYGDSVVVTVVPSRDGAALADLPVMHYKVIPSTFFDPYRTTGLPLTGTVEGRQVVESNGSLSDSKFSFDLPDTGFFFPGDAMHYYFTATDDISGMNAATSILPADTLGFSDFKNTTPYNQSFIFRALPSVGGMDGEVFDTPRILLWDDLGYSTLRSKWHLALSNNYGLDYDVYYTNAASSRLGNGLGRKATVEQLDAYDIIFYASGHLYNPTLARTLDVSHATPNLDALDYWLTLGHKNLFLAGDNVASSLAYSSPQGMAFLDGWMGVEFLNEDVRPFISGQATPMVNTTAENPVFYGVDAWMAYGGCPGVNDFDAVETTNGAVKLAEFLAPDGSAGFYPYSAATLKVNYEFDARVISLPYDLGYIWNDQSSDKAPASLPVRAQIVYEALAYFGVTLFNPTPAPDAVAFSVRNYPNPFNPKTSIEYTMPGKAHLKIRVFNLRGELVQTLVDEVRTKGAGSVMWDGTNRKGKPVSAGVYFYEARTGNKVEVGKMSLVK